MRSVGTRNGAGNARLARFMGPLCVWVALASGAADALRAQGGRPEARIKPVFTAESEALSALRYDAREGAYLFDVALFARMGLLFEGPQAKALLSIDYREDLGAGESYIRGGTEYSNITVGYYVENWCAAYSRGLSSVLNERDDRYPDNIFFSRNFKPNPILSMTVGRESLWAQAALSNRKAPIGSIGDSDAGIRGVLRTGPARASAGIVKRIGDSSVLSFATLEQDSSGGRQWVEVDWKHRPSAEDEWSVAVGFSRELSRSRVAAEYLLLDAEDVVFLEEDLRISSSVRFDLRAYVHLPDFSAAVSGFFIVRMGRGFTFEPGVYGFIGRQGRYFSPTEAENDNSAVIRLRFSFE